jgi:transposase-like protein
MKKRRIFSAKQKSEIVIELLKSSGAALEIAKKHDLSPSVLDRWKNEFLTNAEKVFDKQADIEKDKKIKKYEYVITKMTTQNDFLEKVLAHMERV